MACMLTADNLNAVAIAALTESVPQHYGCRELTTECLYLL